MTTMEILMESLGGSSASVFEGTPLENVEKAFSDWKADESGKVYARFAIRNVHKIVTQFKTGGCVKSSF